MIKTISIATTALVLCGCAFSKTQVPVNFAPTVKAPLTRQTTAAFFVEEPKDSRTVSEKTVILQKANAYGATTGAYVAPKPVSEILREGIIAALKQNLFQIAGEPGSLHLETDIQQFDVESISGFWTAKLTAKLQARFSLVDKGTGLSVWRDTFVGRATTETALASGQTLASLFEHAADDLVKQLITDSNLRKILEK